MAATPVELDEGDVLALRGSLRLSSFCEVRHLFADPSQYDYRTLQRTLRVLKRRHEAREPPDPAVAFWQSSNALCASRARMAVLVGHFRLPGDHGQLCKTPELNEPREYREAVADLFPSPSVAPDELEQRARIPVARDPRQQPWEDGFRAFQNPFFREEHQLAVLKLPAFTTASEGDCEPERTFTCYFRLDAASAQRVQRESAYVQIRVVCTASGMDAPVYSIDALVMNDTRLAPRQRHRRAPPAREPSIAFDASSAVRAGSNSFTVQRPQVARQTFPAVAAVVQLVTPQTVDELVSRVPRGVRSSAELEGAGVEFGGERVALADPLCLRRMAYPGRSRTCVHRSCFDIKVFLEYCRQLGVWECPVCCVPCLVEKRRRAGMTFDSAIVISDCEQSSDDSE
eukprot:m51a1_g10942 putative miz-type zinc finger-containing protein (400) ;mRNA; r:185760-187498